MSQNHGKKDNEPRNHRDRVRRGDTRRRRAPRGYEQPQNTSSNDSSSDQRGARSYDERPRGDRPQDDRRGGYDRFRNDGPRRDDRPRDDQRGGYGGQRNDGPRRDDRQRDDRRGGFGGPQQDDRRGGFNGPRRDDRQRDDRRGGFGGPRQDDRRGGFGGPRQDDRRDGFDGPRRDDRRGGFDGPRRDDRQRDDRRGGFGGPRQDDRRGGFDGPRRDDRQRDDRRGGFGGPRQDDRRGGFSGPRNDAQRQERRSDDRRGGFKGPRRDDRPSKGAGRRDARSAVRPRDNARDVAAYVVMRVLEEDAFSNMALRSAFRETPMDRRDRAFTTRLTYGTLTWAGYIDAILDNLLPRGLDSLPNEVRSHLRVAMYQLLQDRDHTPVHAAIDGCVELVGKDAPHLRGLANGVLRNFEREREDILNKVSSHFKVEARYGLSKPIADTLLRRVSEEHADDIMAEWNGSTPVIIRSRVQDRDALFERLSQRDDVRVRKHPYAPDALFFEGDVRIILRDEPEASIQDAGAQIASSTLPLDLQGLVVDACAGLGGKSLHLLDLYPDIDLVACDIDKRKLRRFNAGDQEERLTRIEGDMSNLKGAEQLALHAAANQADQGYDAIVIDAPCSALGTLGRHPEVRWKRSKDDVADLSRTQHRLLRTMAKLVRPGGYLVYIVCTFAEEETLLQVDRFMQAHPDYVLAPPTAETADPRIDWAQLTDDTQTISLWPAPHFTDGFFIARFQRKEDALLGALDADDDEDEDDLWEVVSYNDEDEDDMWEDDGEDEDDFEA